MSMTPALREYLIKEKHSIIKYACFFTSLGGKPEKIINEIKEILDRSPKEYNWFIPRKLKNVCKYNEELNKFINKLQKHLK